jgi:hypothetical protein
MSLLKITEGFVFAKKNAGTAQKGQIAMARLVKELNSVKSISSSTRTTVTTGGQTAITLSRTVGATTTAYTISQSGTDLQINGNTLVDNVNTFELKYYNTYNGTSSSTYSPSVSVIEISLKLTGADDVVSEFLDRVSL